MGINTVECIKLYKRNQFPCNLRRKPLTIMFLQGKIKSVGVGQIEPASVSESCPDSSVGRAED